MRARWHARRCYSRNRHQHSVHSQLRIVPFLLSASVSFDPGERAQKVSYYYNAVGLCRTCHVRVSRVSRRVETCEVPRIYTCVAAARIIDYVRRGRTETTADRAIGPHQNYFEYVLCTERGTHVILICDYLPVEELATTM